MEAAAAVTVSKRVAVASWSGLRRIKDPLHISEINLKGTVGLIGKVGGSSSAKLQTPLITMDIDSPRLTREMRDAGYSVKVAQTGKDRKLLLDLVEAVCRSGVSELVILCGDGDLFPIACRKAKQGMTVYWISTSSPANYRSGGLPEKDVEELLRNRIVFIDLAAHREEISGGEPANTAGLGAVSPMNPALSTYTIEMKNPDQRAQIEFASELRQLIARFKGAKVTSAT
jgi:uncharacterized LabA/DUF88 family protein